MEQTVLRNPYIPATPTIQQAKFLALPTDEALYGGAAGGGKSVALLMGALQFATHQNYAALLIRRTFADLQQPGALIDISKQWLTGRASWNENKMRWTFASGASLTFGYLDNDNDKYRYQGSEFQYIGFDELTQIPDENWFTYLASRLRRKEHSTIPVRLRSASNPGGIGHDWVYDRYFTRNSGPYIPAKLEDNPHLDRLQYEEQLAKLDSVTRAQLRHGDWDVKPDGNVFKRKWFKGIDKLPRDFDQIIRYWDLAATEQSATSKDPDWTVGAKLGRVGPMYFVLDIVRFRASAQEVERRVQHTARRDGYDIAIRMEQEPGSSGKIVVSNFARLLDGYDFRGIKSTGDKVARAQGFAAAAERGDVNVYQADWNREALDEIVSFPNSVHDDQVDAIVGAYNALARKEGAGWQKDSLEQIFSR